MLNRRQRQMCIRDRSEGIVRDADLLDAGVIFGTGFAPFRGGPLQYARDRGIDDVTNALEQLAREFSDQGGNRFRPHDGWAALGAATGS